MVVSLLDAREFDAAPFVWERLGFGVLEDPGVVSESLTCLSISVLIEANVASARSEASSGLAAVSRVR